MTDREKELDEALEIAVAALRRIEESDPGPARFIAQAALDQIQAATIDKEDQNDA